MKIKVMIVIRNVLHITTKWAFCIRQYIHTSAMFNPMRI